MTQPLTRDQIKRDLQVIFREVFDDPTLEIADAMTAKDVKDWDSINHINLIIDAEKHFGITLTTKEVAALKNVGEFIGLIGSKTH
jgi:acyl carrier protein